MNETLITMLRGVRTSLQILFEPVDFLSRFGNNKKGYPPLWLRQQVGDLRDFEGSGGEYIVYLKLLCDLKSGDRLLDVGCGCGLITLDTTGAGSLLDYLGRDGRYVGLDTNRRLINWCRKHLRGIFLHVDGKSLLFEEDTFDVVLAKSLFTHLLASETENYLKEIKRLLRPNGKCLATFFLLNEQELKGRFKFEYKNGPIAFRRKTRPKLTLAYDEKYLLELIKEVGLVVEQKRYGTWSGRQDGLSFQDIVIMRR